MKRSKPEEGKMKHDLTYLRLTESLDKCKVLKGKCIDTLEGEEQKKRN